ncbi:MAG: ABC transporter ATP-binding protein [Azoarcus sp.]|jgi:ABC-type nitrate/sulfonate/bicarbonate transport system ATPase subunit|nr:ABC transporter ATP-binding protein [Azoarcus sp.]
MLEVRGVTRRFDNLVALHDASLSVGEGEFVAIVGASGCGKTTLLRLIAGLDSDYEGEIALDGQRIVGTSLERGIVFQEPRLLPWLTLWDNVAIALENAPLSAAAKKEAIAAQIALVGLSGFERAYPSALSGGMAQRAAIARALVGHPSILLLDEPLGALDAITRMRLQEELLRIWRHEGVSMILVTHDVEEAVFLSQKIVVMDTHPGHVTATVPVDLPTPRDRASPAFSALKGRVFEALHDNAAVKPPEVEYLI